MMPSEVITGDCLEVMPTLDADSIDSIVTDPPYGLSFMGKDWDRGVPGEAFWRAALRVAKPGAHLLAFGGTRTFHRLACAVEDAGWEIRDCLSWLYGSGFPKSLDVSKAMDKAAGAEREETGRILSTTGNRAAGSNALAHSGLGAVGAGPQQHRETIPSTPAAKQWSGWGTALKPAWEPIIMARKPLIGTVAANVAAHGTGAVNVDGCRVASFDGYEKQWDRPISTNIGAGGYISDGTQKVVDLRSNKPTGGRWPANLILDEEAGAMLDGQAGKRGGGFGVSGGDPNGNGIYGAGFPRGNMATVGYGDSGGASRFFYCPKASKADRDEGCEGLGHHKAGSLNMRTDAHSERNGMATNPRSNHHPTVKPTNLMRWLCRLVTPPGGTVLDPFCGSGSTGKAAALEGFGFIGIELSDEYADIAERRIAAVQQEQA